MGKKLQVSATVVTHRGLGPHFSTDNFYLNRRYVLDHETNSHVEVSVEAWENIFVFAVGDGLGGDQPGEAASLVAVEGLKSLEQELRKNYKDKPVRNKIPLIRDFISRANEQICLMAKEYRKDGMGTTLACLLLSGDKAVTVHLGDSRVYLLRGGELEQLTSDHTAGQQVTRFLGMVPAAGGLGVEISRPLKLQTGDVFLICSDGLTDWVAAERIAEIMAGLNGANEDAGENGGIATMLVREAVAQGGKDNVTAMVVSLAGFQQGRNFAEVLNTGWGKIAATGTVIVLAGLLAFAANLVARQPAGNRAAEPGSRQEQGGLVNRGDQEVITPGREAGETTPPGLPGESQETPGSVPLGREPLPGAEPDRPEGQGQYEILTNYEVQPGDSLFRISLKFYQRNVVEKIKEFNNLPSDMIQVGQSLKLPKL